MSTFYSGMNHRKKVERCGFPEKPSSESLSIAGSRSEAHCNTRRTFLKNLGFQNLPFCH